MYESEIEKRLYDLAYKRDNKKFCFVDLFLKEYPEDLRDIAQYLHMYELAFLDLGFSVADARHYSIFNRDIYDGTSMVDGLDTLQAFRFYDLNWLRQEFEDEFNHTFLSPENPRYCLLPDNYHDTPAIAYQESIDLPVGIIPIDELETPRKIGPKQAYFDKDFINDSEE